MDKVNNIEHLIDYIEDFCGTLAMSHDSPDKESIKEWFEKYDELK